MKMLSLADIKANADKTAKADKDRAEREQSIRNSYVDKFNKKFYPAPVDSQTSYISMMVMTPDPLTDEQLNRRYIIGQNVSVEQVCEFISALSDKLEAFLDMPKGDPRRAPDDIIVNVAGAISHDSLAIANLGRGLEFAIMIDRVTHLVVRLIDQYPQFAHLKKP
jgi:hypothetical protein